MTEKKSSTQIQAPCELKNTICAATCLVTLGEDTKTAWEWAAERGVKWQTVKMRRYRGCSWHEALRSGHYRSPWTTNLILSANSVLA